MLGRIPSGSVTGNHPKIKDHTFTFSNQTHLESFTHVVHEDEFEDPEVQNQKFSYFLRVVCPMQCATQIPIDSKSHCLSSAAPLLSASNVETALQLRARSARGKAPLSSLQTHWSRCQSMGWPVRWFRYVDPMSLVDWVSLLALWQLTCSASLDEHCYGYGRSWSK